ncbi:MAG: hypothetical protein LBH00_08205, partial [Planctomycetaceae bacterium]|nr:hypothetical protein [Planctomycetaceae bacterium]
QRNADFYEMIFSISFSLGLKNSAGTVPAFREKILPKRNSAARGEKKINFLAAKIRLTGQYSPATFSPFPVPDR